MTVTAKIFKPVKSATQSGRAKTKKWLLEYVLETKRSPEALMGWVASGDTLNQVKIGFDSEEEAIAFATKKGWKFDIVEPQSRQLKGRTYLDNFK
jgi:hypothetical protein